MSKNVPPLVGTAVLWTAPLRGLSIVVAGYIALLQPVPACAQLSYWSSYNAQAAEACQNGNNAQAEELWLKAAESAKNIGDNDPRLAMTYRNLGRLYTSLGRYNEAQNVLRQALEINQKSLGTSDPEVAAVEEDLRACSNRTESATTSEKSTQVASSVAAVTFHGNSKYSSAEPAHSNIRPTKQLEMELTPEDEWKASWEEGRRLYNEKDYRGAEKVWRKSVEVASRAGIDSNKVSYSINSLLMSLYAQKKFKDAEVWFQKSMNLVAQLKGTDSPEYQRAVRGYQALLRKLGKHQQAKELAKKLQPANFVKVVASMGSVNHFRIPHRRSAPQHLADIEVATPEDEEDEEQEEEFVKDSDKDAKENSSFPAPHEPNLFRLIGGIIGTIAALKGGAKLGAKISGKLIPEELQPGNKKVRRLKLLCWSICLWWIVPFAGIVGSFIAREFSKSYKPTYKTFKTISDTVFWLSLLTWGTGIIWATFFD